MANPYPLVSALPRPVKPPTPFIVASLCNFPRFFRKNLYFRGQIVIPAAIKKKSYLAALFYYQYN